MQYVNDDMDDVYRKAAEEYPLNTDGANWNKVLSALQNEDEDKIVTKNGRAKFLWLLLLLPLGLVCNHFIRQEDGSAFFGLNQNGATQSNHTTETHNTKQQLPSNIQANEVQHAVVATPITQVITNEGKDLSQKNSVSLDKKQSLIGHQYVVHSGSKLSGLHTTGYKKSTGETTYGNVIDDQNFKMPTQTLAHILQFDKAIITPLKRVEKNNLVTQKPIVKLSHKPDRFYIGIVGGVDATTIKFQKISNAGRSAGFLMGYNLSKKWSIEAGLLMDKKFYYSKGEYFKKGVVYLPPNSQITEVEGNCSMLEIPVTVSQHFHANGKLQWFYTAGLSTYIMKKQNYDYTYYYYNTNRVAVYPKSYSNTLNYLFSLAHVSGGFTYPVGKLGAVRVEPYVNVPLRGMGAGQLPMTSVGMQLGLVKTIF